MVLINSLINGGHAVTALSYAAASVILGVAVVFAAEKVVG